MFCYLVESNVLCMLENKYIQINQFGYANLFYLAGTGVRFTIYFLKATHLYQLEVNQLLLQLA